MFAVAWPVAELLAIPLAANGIKSVQTNAAGVTLVDQTGWGNWLPLSSPRSSSSSSTGPTGGS
jgi:hypothetical protein